MIGGVALGAFLLLAGPAPAPHTAQQREAIRQEAALAAATTASPDRTAARAALRTVLSQRGFRQTEAVSYQDELRRRVTEWFSSLWERTFGRRMGQRTIANLIAWPVAAGAILVLLIWLTQMTARRRAEAPLSLGAIPERRAAGRELALEAAALIAAGRTRDASRVAYRAAVHRLEEEGALTVDEARTPREYLGLLPAPHRRRASLVALTAVFERLWYGSRTATAGEGPALLALLQDMECLPRDRTN